MAKVKAGEIARVKCAEQDAKVRAGNFNEVALGFTVDEAVTEATRCLQCKNPKCIEGCPVEVPIPEFIELIKERRFDEAALKIKEKNSLPAVCGRVCPQETQCERKCLLGVKFEPVNIGKLERFAADWEMGLVEGSPQAKAEQARAPEGAGAEGAAGERAPEAAGPEKPADLKGPKVAVVGSGPAGLTVAGDLAQRGYRVTVLEALHKPGGVLVYGIPEFRLPKSIVQAEVDYVKSLGVELKTSMIVGKTFTIPELLEQGYAAVFIGTGAGSPMFMNIPGENLSGVYSANEFLTRSNLMKAYLFPEYDTPIKRGKKVAVVGGGNVAMDAARTALRLGADKVYLVYRRSEEEMPARVEEVHHAKEEGIDFRLLTNPVRIIEKDGVVGGIECIQMELGEPDESGRRRPVPVDGSEFVLDVDTVIMAIGTTANPIVPSTTPGLDLTKRGYIVADETGTTSLPSVFAGGDIVTGSATVILAMGAGRKAATAIHEYLCADGA